MSHPLTPFGLVFGQLARERFPAIRAFLADHGLSSADRDHFVLLEPVAYLLRELVPDDSPPEALEAHVRLLHHAFRHWTAGAWVYRIGPSALERALGRGRLTAHLAHPALYLQLAERRVWGAPSAGAAGGAGGAGAAGAAAEPLDGMFVTETAPAGALAVLGVFGLRSDRPGFSAVAVEGRADEEEAVSGELTVPATRENGAASFSPLLPGGREAGIYSLANAGELLLLTCRLLALLPATPPRETGNVKRETDALEQFVFVE